MNFETSIGLSTKDKIYVHGFDLTEDLVGEITLADMAYLGVKKRIPSEKESKMLNAILVAICEHGFTPSSMSTRLTHLGAPEAVQASIAAGLLGAGTVYLGAMEYAAEMVQNNIKKNSDMSKKELASKILMNREEAKLPIPGFGHPTHKPDDPRTIKLFELAKELGFYGPHSELLVEIHDQFCEKKGKKITLNAVGAIGAIMSDMDIDYRFVKSFAVASRAVGLIGHIVEEVEHERKNSVGQKLYDYMENNTEYL